MMELIIIACLQSSPLDCEERSIGLYPDTSATSCMITAQPQIAAWSEANPRLRVARFTCRDSASRFTRA